MEAVFRSERIDFVPVSEALIDDYLAMVNDPAVQRMISRKTRVYDREGEREWVRAHLEQNTLVFSMLERATGRFIGNIEYMQVADGAAVLGIAVTAAMQDRGFGTEAVRRFVRYGFETLPVDAVALSVYPFNPRARHVYEKCGFTVCGEPEEDDSVPMRVSREDFMRQDA